MAENLFRWSDLILCKAGEYVFFKVIYGEVYIFHIRPDNMGNSMVTTENISGLMLELEERLADGFVFVNRRTE